GWRAVAARDAAQHDGDRGRGNACAAVCGCTDTGTDRASEHNHAAAARFRSEWCTDNLFHRPRCAHDRSAVRRPATTECADPALVDRRALVRGTRVERRRTLPGLERYSE